MKMNKELYSFDIKRLMMKSHEMLIYELIETDKRDSFAASLNSRSKQRDLNLITYKVADLFCQKQSNLFSQKSLRLLFL
jgi:hypothetical protein